MLDTLNTIGNLLDKHKPAGARWVVVASESEGFKSCYGPWNVYVEASKWMGEQAILNPMTIFEVVPLYQRSNDDSGNNGSD